jgi:hypothetical protein
MDGSNKLKFWNLKNGKMTCFGEFNIIHVIYFNVK